jgi:glutathione S-transferase
MEQHLAGRNYLATEHPTIADLACYSYVAHAPEGSVSLEPLAYAAALTRKIKIATGILVPLLYPLMSVRAG